ncbi:MAG: PKD domain-containing protein [Chitinophagaceae bacterium]
MGTVTRLFLSLAFSCLATVIIAQGYNNIEFVENKGQWDSDILYRGELNTGVVYIRSGGFTITQHNPKDMGAIQEILHGHSVDGSTTSRSSGSGGSGKLLLRGHTYTVDFINTSPTMKVVADKPVESYNNYIIGNDPSKWAGNCKIYQAITFREIYPNVDVRYYTYNGVMKYDIIARPGADLSRIAMKYTGADKLFIKNKELVISTSVGDLHESAPYTYQFSDKQRKEVNSKYVVKNNIVSFDVKSYDKNSTLVIDPTLIFCSFSGASTTNWGFTATYGPDGSFYGGGIMFRSGFPATPGAFQENYDPGNNSGDAPGKIDIAVMKLNANGSALVYATYVGGTGNEQPHSLVVDNDGNLVIAGRSNSPNYPVRGSASTLGLGYDVVITKLNAAGTGLIGSVKVGGEGNDGVNISVNRSGTTSLQQNYGDDGRSEVILDGAGNILVASSTSSTSLSAITTGSFQPTIGGKQDGLLLKFNSTLSNRIFASYLGGSGNDAAYVLALAPTGDIYVAGGTESANLPGSHAGTVGPSQFAPDGIDGFVAQVSSNGGSIIRSTWIGTNVIDQLYGIQFDRFGYPYVMGTTTGNISVINAGYSVANAKQFIAKLQPDLSTFIYRTTFGSPNATRPNISPTAFLVDRCENVYVSGWGGQVSTGYLNSGTAGMPVTPDALPFPRGGPDGQDFYFFVLRRDAVGPGPLFASYFGQNGGLSDHVDGGTSRFDRNGVIYQAMCANCGGGGVPPTTPGAYMPTNGALANLGCNLGMAKIAFNLAGVGVEVQSAIGGVPRDTAGCLPLLVTFTDIVRNATEYIWDFGDGSPIVGPLPAAAGYSQDHTYNTVGDYRVMLIAIDPASCNQRDTSYINIRVGDLKANLLADFVKTGACNSLEFRFNNNSFTDPTRPFTDSSFIWDFGDGSPRVVSGTAPITHTFPATGPYVVRLVLNDTAYCNNPDSLVIPINVAANVDAQFTTPPQGCAIYEAVFNSSATIGGLNFEWDFGDSTSADNTSTLANPVHIYTTPGTYTIRMVANNPNTCNLTDTTYTTIIVLEGPLASFTYTPVTPVLNTPNVFRNTSSANAIRFVWIFGDGDTLATTSRADVTHQYNSPGVFTACLVAFNRLDCPDTTCQDVTTLVEPALDVPNAFTPMSNDINSIAMPRGYGIAKIMFTIYNRQGKKVFETSSRNQGWDGRVGGVIQPMDVYAYTLAVEFFDGTKATKTGDITLIR